MPKKCRHSEFPCDFICTCECPDCDSDAPKRQRRRRPTSTTDNLTGLIGLGIIGAVAVDLFD